MDSVLKSAVFTLPSTDEAEKFNIISMTRLSIRTMERTGSIKSPCGCICTRKCGLCVLPSGIPNILLPQAKPGGNCNSLQLRKPNPNLLF